MANPELIRAHRAPTRFRPGKGAFISTRPASVAIRSRGPSSGELWITGPTAPSLVDGGAPFKRLPYQMSTVGHTPTVLTTGNGESGFGSGEGARETATTSKEGSRRATYPLPARGGSDEK